jgi:hypothetical protein
MKQNGTSHNTGPELRVHGQEEGASFQVIVLVSLPRDELGMEAEIHCHACSRCVCTTMNWSKTSTSHSIKRPETGDTGSRL